MLPTMFGVNWLLGLGEEAKNSFSRWLPRRPSWISDQHEVLMVSYCGQSMSVVRRAASTIALKAYSSYTPGPVDPDAS